MIEKNLTDLDKDFMIAWAKYCLSNDYSEISRQIQFLAEQNQINAIQSWYQFNKIGDNRIIDTNVSALNGYTFNECFVEANVQYSKDEQLFLQMRNECIEIDKAMDCVEDVRRIEYLRQKMSEFAFLKLYAKTINMAIGEFKVSKNPAILERADELCYYGFYILFQKPSLELRLRHRKTVSLLRKALKKAEKSQNAAKKDEILIYKFALAKALYLFDFSKDSKQVAEGRMLLAEFATMQYSNSPKAYVASAVQQQVQQPQQKPKPKQKTKQEAEVVAQPKPIKNEIDELFRSKPKRASGGQSVYTGEIDEIFMQAQKNVEQNDEATK